MNHHPIFTELPQKVSKLFNSRKSLSKYYSTVYGARWPRLYDALLQKSPKVARLNRHAEWSLDEIANDPDWHPQLPGVLKDATDLYVHPPFDTRGDRLKPYYMMNPSSIRAALALGVQPNDTVLDCCAAPGGKTLVFDHILSDGNGTVVANDLSKKRRYAMHYIFKEYLPGHRIKQIDLQGIDASYWGDIYPNSFDKVMCDVPCGAERLFLHASEKKRKGEKMDWLWSVHHLERMQRIQAKILASAIKTLKPGGDLLYVTCSINPMENDGIITEVAKKFRGMIELKPIKSHIGESTKHGVIILPDVCESEGPMYMCCIHRTS